MMGTRLDLAYTVGKLGSFASNPSGEHLMLAKRVIAYVNHNIKIHIRYKRWDDVSAHGLGLDGYADADFVDKALPEHKSTLGCVFYLSGAVFSWRSKWQETMVTSTTESEYIALYTECIEGFLKAENCF